MNELVRRVLRADGTSEDLTGPVTIAQIERLIDARCIDCVNLRHMEGPRHVMCVDDEGWETEVVETALGVELVPVRARKPVNHHATRLYRLSCSGPSDHQIVGDVVIVPDDDFAGMS